MRLNMLSECIEIVEKEYQITFPEFYGGIGYGENMRWHLEPNREHSKIKPNSKKMLQVIINRDDSGMYELLTYIN